MTPTRSQRWLVAAGRGRPRASAAQLAAASSTPTEPPAPTAGRHDGARVGAERDRCRRRPTAPRPRPRPATRRRRRRAATAAAVRSARSGVDLSGVCPETVVIQTDWNPEAEHGWLYQLVGDDPRIDEGRRRRHRAARRRRRRHRRRHRDPLRRPGDRLPDGDVAALHRRRHPARLRLHRRGDPDLGRVPDRRRVMSGMEKNPQMIMWDPATYPDVADHRRPRQGRRPVRYFGGAAYMDYFTQTGILSADQVDGSYDGTPATFVAAGGNDAQQGFGSAEPYIYENEVAGLEKPVAYQYINDAGWENYAESIATKPENLETVPRLPRAAGADHPAVERRLPRRPGRDQRADHRRRRARSTTAGCTAQGVADYAVETMINDGLIEQRPERHARQLRPRPRQRPDREGRSRCTRRSARRRRTVSPPRTS